MLVSSCFVSTASLGKMGHVTLTTPILGVQSTCVQNLTILALDVPQISLGASEFKVGHVTVTVRLLRVCDLSFLCWDVT